MITLKEILHTIGEEKKSGLIPIDSWKWSEADHLATMGFKFSNDYKMQTDKPPYMTIYKQKHNSEESLKEKSSEKGDQEFFYLEEREKPTKRFKEFNDLIEFFDRYEQPEIDKNR